MGMTLPILYSRRSDGGVQTWSIEISGAKYRTTSGIKDGSLVTAAWTVAKGKNLGRSNETSPEQQAEAEARAAWQKQINSGYTEDIQSVDNKTFFEPMLAKKYSDYKDEIVFPVWAQPKLDGMRCIARADGLWSRKGKPILSAPHIFAALAPVFKKYPKAVFDGELYADKFKDDFNKIISLAKKQKPTAEDLAESAEHLQYWVYDCVFAVDAPFSMRSVRLSTKINALRVGCVFPLVTVRVSTQEKLDELHGWWLEEGYEGQIIRVDGVPYEHKRTSALLKRKEFIDEEFKLLDVLEGEGNRAGVAAKVSCVTSKGVEFEAGVIGNIGYCRELLQNKKQVVGQMATIKYFNLTPAGKPRHGKLKAIRNYE